MGRKNFVLGSKNVSLSLTTVTFACKQLIMKNFSLSEKIFILFCFLLPFPLALNISAGIDLPLIRILPLIIFIFWLLDSLAKGKIEIDTRSRFFIFLFFLIWISFSYFWADEKERALRKIGYFISFFPLYFPAYAFLKNTLTKNACFKAIIGGALLSAIIGISQFIFQFLIPFEKLSRFWFENISPFILGRSFSALLADYPSLLVNVGGKTLLRSFGSFPDPHIFATFLLMVIPLAIFFHQKFNSWFIIIIFVLGILLSFSRAGYLALICGMIIFLIKNLNTDWQKSLSILILPKNSLKIISSLFAIVLFFSIPNPIVQRFFSSFNLQEGSNNGRITMWKEAWHALIENPIGGVGIGNFSYFIDQTSSYRNPIYAHNLFLDFGAETGFIGLILTALLIITPIFSLRKSPWRKNPAALSLIFLLFFSLFESPFYSVSIFPLFLIYYAN